MVRPGIRSSCSGTRSPGLAGLDAGGRRAEVERQIGIADARPQGGRATSGGADYGVCRRADPEGPAPSPELSARGGASCWNAVRGRVRALSDGPCGAAGGGPPASGVRAPAARLAALEAREASALEAELRSVREEAAALVRGRPRGPGRREGCGFPVALAAALDGAGGGSGCAEGGPDPGRARKALAGCPPG